jgi:hypothetical protein
MASICTIPVSVAPLAGEVMDVVGTVSSLYALIELFTGAYTEVHLFSTEEALKHHPVFHRLTSPRI